LPDKLCSMDFKSRQRRVQDSLESAKLDILLVTHPPNIRYLSGFTGSAGALLLTPEKSVFFTDGRYTEQAHTEVSGARVRISKQQPIAAAAAWLESNTSASRTSRIKLGVEAEHVTVAQRTRLLRMLPLTIRLTESPALVERMRMIKDADEIELLRSAVLLGAELFATALKAIRPGVKEAEVAAEMEYEARRAGAEEMSFPTIIASGSRSALPHGRAAQVRIPARGFVVCDFGVILSGYCSDMTRTVHVGRPTAEARNIYNAVREAQQAAAQAVRPGIKVAEVDRAARMLLKKERLDCFFTHSTGHGVGLEIHEGPRIAHGSPEVLRPGMVITIEPGAYIAGKCGVRIEDMLLVTERGHEVLTPTSKELVSL
jgi:Xaa-Pro aminopeptidase